MPQNALFALFPATEFDPLESLTDAGWKVSDRITLERDWLGRSLIRQKGLGWRHLCEVRSLWTPTALCFHIQCWFEQQRDDDRVILFLRPASRADYFQFEVRSDGKSVDSHVRRPRVDVDYSWSSHLEVSSQVSLEERIWWASLRIPFSPSWASAPCVGEGWRFNVVRSVGEGADLDFISWRPTFTPLPDPHVPESFGVLIFLGSEQ